MAGGPVAAGLEVSLSSVWLLGVAIFLAVFGTFAEAS